MHTHLQKNSERFLRVNHVHFCKQEVCVPMGVCTSASLWRQWYLTPTALPMASIFACLKSTWVHMSAGGMHLHGCVCTSASLWRTWCWASAALLPPRALPPACWPCQSLLKSKKCRSTMWTLKTPQKGVLRLRKQCVLSANLPELCQFIVSHLEHISAWTLVTCQLNSVLETAASRMN